MRRPLFHCLLLAHATWAQEPAVLTDARRALKEGIPQVAIAKLQSARAANRVPAPEQHAVTRLLAEAQLAAGKAEEALATIQDLPEQTDTSSLLFRANVEAAAGRWSSAFLKYQDLSSRPDAPIAAALGEAESLQAMGRTAEALSTLRRAVNRGTAPAAAHLRLASLYVEVDRPADARKTLETAPITAPADEKWRQHLEARILLLEKEPRAALARLESLLADKTGLSHNLLAASTLALAEARLALSGPDSAEKTLESFIRQYHDSPQLELIFRRLDQIYATDPNPAEGALHGFFIDLPPRASALGQFYVTRLQLRERRFERAQKSLEIFLKRFPNHELVPYAQVMQAELHKQAGNLAGAEQALDAASRAARGTEQRAELALEAAAINLDPRQGEYVRAATRLKAAETFPRLKQTAAYNAALSWLMQQNYARFREDLAAFAAQFQSPVLIGQLRLEEGLSQARYGHAAAMDTLKAFLRDFPEHERRAEAQIGLAELAFLRGDHPQAQTLLAAARDEARGGTPAEQADYLEIFLADKKNPRDPAEVIRLSREFIARHVKSALVAEVRMKLGQVYFAEEDYLKAQEQFENVAASEPTGSYAEMALFLAGQCGMRLINTDALNRAVELFDKVAERNGPLEMRARLQQAIIKNKLGAEDDAVKIYDTIISEPGAIDLEIRYAALIGKGDNLTAVAQKHPANEAVRERALNDAIQSYDLLLAGKAAPAQWTNQAAYKKGKALQQLGRADEALAVFYDVLNRQNGDSRETFWYAKAGFDAAASLESRKNWKHAVAIYEKMAKLPGQHAAQAKQRVKTLRLEHFLWD